MNTACILDETCETRGWYAGMVLVQKARQNPLSDPSPPLNDLAGPSEKMAHKMGIDQYGMA